MIKGWNHFKENFRQYKDSFILVGGVASHLQLEEIGAPRVRPTRDLDIVLMIKPSNEFLEHLRNYINKGEYEIEKGDNDQSIFYRFQKPKQNQYPEMIELFSPAIKGFKLHFKQHIIPVATPKGVDSLSAILLDQDYYDLIKNNAVEKDGIYLLSPWALIPFKAKAYLEIKERKEDSKKWKKHRGDIINLAVSFLDDNKKMTLKGMVREHFEEFVVQLRNEINNDVIKGACMQNIPGDKILSLLEIVFL